jgi:imidazole glycerol phosphate synthase subunit HisF
VTATQAALIKKVAEAVTIPVIANGGSSPFALFNFAFCCCIFLFCVE